MSRRMDAIHVTDAGARTTHRSSENTVNNIFEPGLTAHRLCGTVRNALIIASGAPLW
jgi:hypothetical protein